MSTMTLRVESWNPTAATARVSLYLDGWELGPARQVDEATLMMLTASAAEPALMVGKTYQRDLVDG